MKMPRVSVRSRIAAATAAAILAGGAAVATAGPASADSVTPAQLETAGWACEPAHLFPLLVCFIPGQGFPPLPGSPGFASRLPSYEVLIFDLNTGAFLGLSHSLRPDIYLQGTPPCPQQPSGQYFFNPFNDMYICNTLGADPAP